MARSTLSALPRCVANICLVLLCFFLRYGLTLDAEAKPHTDVDGHGSEAGTGETHAEGHDAVAHAEGGHDEHEIHHYHVFHVEFERVQLPFIIMLWIFVSSLAKIGKF